MFVTLTVTATTATSFFFGLILVYFHNPSPPHKKKDWKYYTNILWFIYYSFI